MAEIMSGAVAIERADQAQPTGYAIKMKRYDASGVPSELSVHIPEGASLDAIKANPLLLTAVLKDGDPTWRQMEPGFILVAVMHAASLGLDILQGDVYAVEGRIGISDWAKIKYARSHGYRADVEIEDGPEISIPWETRKETKILVTPNFKATATVYDSNGQRVSTYTTDLKQWFGNSTEWFKRPKESLRRKCLARAYQEVCPVGTEPDEVPAPTAMPSMPSPSLGFGDPAGKLTFINAQGPK